MSEDRTQQFVSSVQNFVADAGSLLGNCRRWLEASENVARHVRWSERMLVAEVELSPDGDVVAVGKPEVDRGDDLLSLQALWRQAVDDGAADLRTQLACLRAAAAAPEHPIGGIDPRDWCHRLVKAAAELVEVLTGRYEHIKPALTNAELERAEEIYATLLGFRADAEALGDDGPQARVSPQVWVPKPGYIGAKEICNDSRFEKHGRKVPRTTLSDWAAADQPEMSTDPATGEVFYSQVWFDERWARWSPRRP